MPAAIDSSDYSVVVWCTQCEWFSVGAWDRLDAAAKRDAHNTEQAHTGPEGTIAESLRLKRLCACGQPVLYVKPMECRSCYNRRTYKIRTQS